MKLTKLQLKKIVENYLLEQDSDSPEIEEEPVEEPRGEQEALDRSDVEQEKPETPDTAFKVRYDDKNVDIELKSLKDNRDAVKSTFVNGELRTDIDAEKLQTVAAHGYIHKDTSQEAKDVLKKILSRDVDFKGKSESGIKAVIADKMSSKLGVQSLGLEKLRAILDIG